MKSELELFGDVYEHKNFLIFFGTKKADLVELQRLLPSKKLCLLKQTHGSVLQKAEPATLHEGDAQWSENTSDVLLIKTADCMPVMVASPRLGISLAIHSGWRGVAQQIVEKSILALKLQNDPGLRLWIGPHIQWNNFEVGEDVATQILAPYGHKISSPKLDDLLFKKGEKFHLNLSLLTLKSLAKIGVTPEQISITAKDTLTMPEYYSYRRGENGVRNYSFITRSE